MGQDTVERAIPPTTALALAARLLAKAPDLLAASGAPGATAPGLGCTRRWTPMDGAQPPYCPFVEDAAGGLTHAGWSVSVSASVAYWNEAEVSGASVSVHLRRAETLVAGAFGAVTQSSVIPAMHVSLHTATPEAQVFAEWLGAALEGGAP